MRKVGSEWHSATIDGGMLQRTDKSPSIDMLMFNALNGIEIADDALVLVTIAINSVGLRVLPPSEAQQSAE